MAQRAGRPNARDVVLNSDGTFTDQWYRLFFQLWLRTGGSQDNVTAAAPAGTFAPFAGNNIPDGWLLAHGQEVSRSEYPSLFSAIGTIWGAGDGVNTFNLPDGRGRSFIGAGTGTGLTPRTVGDILGEETHTMTESEIFPHNHTVTDPGHSHNVTDSGHEHSSDSNNFVNDGSGTEYLNTGGNDGATSANTANATTGISIDSATTGITIDDTGDGDPFNVIQPSFVGNWIIRT